MSKELVERLRDAVVDEPNYGLALRMSLQAEDVREAADLIERQDRALREMSGLLEDLDLGRSIHNSRFPDQNIDGPLWAQIPRVLESTRTLKGRD